MTPAKLTTLRDIRQWQGTMTELIETARAMSLEQVLACTETAKVSSTLTSYLHLEGSVMPSYTSIGGLPRELAQAMKDCFKRVRNATTHRALADEYQVLMSLYDKVPDTATGRARDIPLARNRPELVRVVEFGVTIHRRIHANLMAIPEETKRIEMYTAARGMLVNHRSLPMLESAQRFHARISEACDAVLAI